MDNAPDIVPGAEPAGSPAVAAAAASLCRHLRSNAMYLFGDQPDEKSDGHDDFGSSVCWCALTMKPYGPDDELAGRRECRDSARACHEPL